MDFLSRFGFHGADSRIQNQPTTSGTDAASDEMMADAEDEPDERQSVPVEEKTADFKKLPCAMSRKQSLLTQTLHSGESDSQHDDDYSEVLFSGSNRAHSSASTWSRGSASEAGLTSDGHASPSRACSPSSPAPPAQFVLPPHFNQKPFEKPATTKIAQESVDPLRKPAPSENEDAVEKGLGRKRCIMFACKGKVDEKKEEPQKAGVVRQPDPVVPAKRPCALKFVCPVKTTTPAEKPRIRLASPPPSRIMPRSPKLSRNHRGSDCSTVRNESPKSVRKVPSVIRARRGSNASQIPICEATRFHEFASSEEEREDWTAEKSCYRNRLTVQDTLKVENGLRKLGEEAEEEEELEDEEVEEQLAHLEDEEDIEDDDEEEDNHSLVDSTGYVTDEGFHTDDEEGFADSDDESDAGSDYRWWAPGNGSRDVIEHIRPLAPRSESGSSIGSFSSTRVFPSKTPTVLKRSKTNPIEFRPRTPELPDSTDFVCGTLDEDKPLEEAWKSCQAQRRAAKHRLCAQDIDPTFPTSDPELDEEDEEGYEDIIHMDVDDDDHHFLIHGHPGGMSDEDKEERQPRGIVPKKRSPAHSPRRLRSPPPAAKLRLHSPPPPAAKVRLHSPPPRRLFGHSPKRVHSPAPRRPLQSPPPSRHTSLTTSPPQDFSATPIALAQRPHYDRAASSVPRNGPFPTRASYFHDSDDDNDGDVTQTDALPTRGAIDIVKGLEKKRQRRKEKLFEKQCRLRNKSKKHAHHDVVLPGIGAEKMRQMGEGLCKIRGHGIKKAESGMHFEQGSAEHILSY